MVPNVDKFFSAFIRWLLEPKWLPKFRQCTFKLKRWAH